MGSVGEPLAEGSPLGGVVDGGGMSGVTINGSSCCRSSPTSPAMSTEKIATPTFASGKQVMDSRWGLSRGLRRGLGSGLMMMVSGAPVVLAGGLSLARVLALFANLCANVSVSLQRQAKVRQVKSSKIKKLRGAVMSPYSLSASLSLNEETSKSTSASVLAQGGGVGALGRLAAAEAAG